MRSIYVVFIVVSLFLVGCSGAPDQVEPKTTSSFTQNINGYIAWDTLPNPPLDLKIAVGCINPGLSNEGTFYAPPNQAYTEYSFSFSASPGDYEFYPDVPDGYSITPETIIVYDYDGTYELENITFVLEKD